MPQTGGKNAKKKSSSSSTKRHFTVVIGNKEHGLYVSSSPSSAARKAVSKLCATDKKRKVQFSIREITQGSKKKTYGPYLGEIEKLAKPIELKGRVVKYKPVAKLADKKKKTGGAKKKGSILVVEAKDGKVSKKYITKKQADKHMKPRHKRIDKGMKPFHKSMDKSTKPLHKSMDKSMKKLHKSMWGGAEHAVPEQIQNPSSNYIIKVSRSFRNGPIQILLFNEGNEFNPPDDTITYDKSKQFDFKTDSTRKTYLITNVNDLTLKEFLLKYTDSMGNDNNFPEILTKINEGL
jgi:hypothetical protein